MWSRNSNLHLRASAMIRRRLTRRRGRARGASRHVVRGRCRHGVGPRGGHGTGRAAVQELPTRCQPELRRPIRRRAPPRAHRFVRRSGHIASALIPITRLPTPRASDSVQSLGTSTGRFAGPRTQSGMAAPPATTTANRSAMPARLADCIATADTDSPSGPGSERVAVAAATTVGA